MKYCYSKAQRLCHNADFKRVLNQANRYKGNQITLYHQLNDLGVARVGICIGKRHIKHAATRNRIKRLIRESFRHHPIKSEGLDIIVLVYKGIERKNNADITKGLEPLWDKLISYYKKAS